MDANIKHLSSVEVLETALTSILAMYSRMPAVSVVSPLPENFREEADRDTACAILSAIEESGIFSGSKSFQDHMEQIESDASELDVSHSEEPV